jgi:ABC-type branched-subunit amino acid transport system substrate-binding protein
MTSRLGGLAAVFVVTWAATAVAAPSGPPIRIGGTLALTGPLAVPYTKVDTQAAGSYAAWQMLEAAVTATKSLDDKLMARWLRKNPVPTIVGRFRFDGPNNYGDDLTKVKQVQDGKWIVVWPKEFAPPGARLLP